MIKWGVILVLVAVALGVAGYCRIAGATGGRPGPAPALRACGDCSLAAGLFGLPSDRSALKYAPLRVACLGHAAE